jgi:Ca2+-dependent lipid-binding protein
VIVFNLNLSELFSGKSDPYAVFSLNGQKVFKSQTKKKTVTPEWNETFEVEVVSSDLQNQAASCDPAVPKPSRVAGDFSVEIFDWNQIEQAKSLGTAKLDLASLEPFQASEQELNLVSSKHGEKGKVRVRMVFRPQIITKTRKQTSTFGAAGRAMTQIGALPVGASKGVFHGSSKRKRILQRPRITRCLPFQTFLLDKQLASLRFLVEMERLSLQPMPFRMLATGLKTTLAH